MEKPKPGVKPQQGPAQAVVIFLHALTIVLGALTTIFIIVAIFLAQWGTLGDDYMGLFMSRKNGACDTTDVIYPELGFIDVVTALMFCGLVLFIASLTTAIIFTAKTSLDFLQIFIAVLAFIAGLLILSATAHFYYENLSSELQLGSSWAFAMTSGILALVYWCPLFLLVCLGARTRETPKAADKAPIVMSDSMVIGESYETPGKSRESLEPGSSKEEGKDTMSTDTETGRPTTREGSKSVVFVLGDGKGEKPAEPEDQTNKLPPVMPAKGIKVSASDSKLPPLNRGIGSKPKDTPAPLPPQPKPNVDTPATEMLANGLTSIKDKAAKGKANQAKAKGAASGSKDGSPAKGGGKAAAKSKAPAGKGKK